MGGSLFDGMELNFILDEVKKIDELVEYTEDDVGMRYFMAVAICPDSGFNYCKIHLGEFILWDSEEECREYKADGQLESLVECIQRRVTEHVKTAARIGEACAMMNTAEGK